MSTGKVWLVGAGPGDAGLLTLKGKEILDQAEVVVYDSLVGQGILTMIPDHARCIHAGKHAGNHIMPQEKINEMLLEEAQKGYRVVRLKGGDPFLFGRGGEELELFAEHGIPYEVVPGITSPLAVPAYHGIPVTHRDYCSSLHIITGHKRAGGVNHIDFEALVNTGGTLVFLMGVAALSDICAGLMAAGMDGDMPAAVLEKGTTAVQKRTVATLATLEAEVVCQGVETPAIILVGKVCALAEKFAWYEKLPLSGCKIVVTRPKQMTSIMAKKLRDEGAEVLELPAIATIPIKNNTPLEKALEQMHRYRWIAFTSPTGVRVFFEEMRRAKKDIRSMGNCKIAAIGAGTGKELEGRGIFVDLMPEVYDGIHLGQALAQSGEPGCRVLLPRAKCGNPQLVDSLEKAGFLVDDVAIYDTLYHKQEIIDEKAEFESGAIDWAVFTSASTVAGFVESTKGLDYTRVRAACIGKQTRQAAQKYGMKCYTAKEATMDSLVELIKEERL